MKRWNDISDYEVLVFPTELSGLPTAIQLRNLARYAGMASVIYIARMPQQRKLLYLHSLKHRK